MARPREFEEDQVLDGAMELFWERGFEGTSLGDLESALGIGRQSLYNAFGDKRSLFLAALERYNGRSRDAIAELANSSGGLPDLRRYLYSLVDFLTPEGSRKGCFLTRSVMDTGAGDVEVCDRFTAHADRVQQALAGSLRTAVESGQVQADLPVEATARLLASQVFGMGVMARGNVGREELTELVDTMLSRL